MTKHPSISDKAAHYDSLYRQRNVFGYREWLYGRYVGSLVRACGLEPGATVLDVGCGQGLFSSLFSKHGSSVHGIDISEVGVRAAQQAYGHLGASFAVADIESDALGDRQFDCVFVRGLSLYNRPDFAENDATTARLLSFVKPGGLLLFVYYSNCSSKKSESWRYHSWQEMQRHFRRHDNAKFYFSFKLDAWLLGKLAFTAPITRLNMLVSRVSRRGGDFICLVRKPRA